MFERLADDAKRAIFFANVEAVHRKDPAISVRDLLVGLTWESDCPPARVGLLKDQALELRAAVGIPHLPSTSIPYYGNKVEIPLDSEGKKAIAYAVEEADHDRRYWIGADDLLRALLRFPNDAAHALQACGVDLEALRIASQQTRLAAPDRPTPRWRQLKALVKKYRAAILLFLILLLVFAYLKSQG